MEKKSIENKTFSFDFSNFKTGKWLARMTSLLALSLFLLLTPSMTAAQAVSGVTGVVTDPGGGLIPGVQVLLFDSKTSRELTTTTNDEGVYSFNNIQPGQGFRLTFTGTGFQTFVINDVQLGIGKTETQNAQLTAGQVSEVVEVTSTSGDATLNTTDASIGNIIGRRQLRELPIQLRGSPASLIGLQPGAIGNNVGAGGGNRTGSVTGSRADQGNITVDGIDANDVTTGQPFNTVANAPIDSIQEFRAVTSGPNASEGRSSGGQIQLTTNSGTNEFHGSLREYYRTDETAANSFFNNRAGRFIASDAAVIQGRARVGDLRQPRPKLKRNQFGGSLGGPLPTLGFGEGGPVVRSGKDKTFFFFDYEGRRDDSETTTSRVVPLQSFREGRIGYILATSTANGSACPANSRIDTRPDCVGFLTQAQAAALDPRGTGVNQALLGFINSRFPLPNDLNGGDGLNTGLLRFNAPNVRSDDIYTGRVDVTPTNNQKFFVRTTITRRTSTNALQQFPGDADAVSLSDQSFAIAGGHTWVINESLTNSFIAGLSKSVNIFTPAAASSFPNSFTFGILTAPFASLSYQDRNVFVPTFRDDVTYTIGSHNFQFGVSYKPIRQKPGLINDFNFVGLGLGGNTAALNASLRPTNIRAGSTASFDAAYAFLLGRIASISTNFVYDQQGNPQAPGTGRRRSYAYNEYESYVQDNWKVRSDLTLNLGLRYHLYPAPYEQNGLQAANNVDFQELVDIRIKNAANGVFGNNSEPLTSFNLNGKANNGAPLYETDKNNFAPRIGFAYNPSFENGVLRAVFGDRKTVIRGNASIVYDRPAGAITFIQDQSNFLFDNSATTNFGSTNPATSLLNDPRFTTINTLPVQNVAPRITRPNTPFVDADGVPFGTADGQTNYVVAKDFQIPYSYTFNFGVERELPGNMLLDVSYVGRLGKKLFAQADAAQALNFRDNASGQFMFDAFNNIQAQLQAGVAPGSLTPQPWLENQLLPAIQMNYGPGATCGSFGLGSNCTQLVANFLGELVSIGDSSDTVQQLYANGLLRPNVGISSQFATNSYIGNFGSSEYHGMLVSLQKRFSQGFEFEVNYTWSHSIDNQSSVVNTVAGGLICDVRDLRACRGDSDFDIRHLFNANYIVELPFGRGRAFGSDMPKWLDAFVGGFTFSGIVGARSGLAINSNTGSYSVSYLVDSPAVLIGDRSTFSSNIREEGGGIQFFSDVNKALGALRYPKHGENGSRNIFRSPAYVSFDMGLSKKFKMPWSENHQITIRADSFNVFNQNSFSVPSLDFSDPTTFGRITTSLSAPREFQFAIRYDF